MGIYKIHFLGRVLDFFYKFPHPVSPSDGRSVGRSVCHNFLRGREVSNISMLVNSSESKFIETK